MSLSQNDRIDRQGWIALGLSFLALFFSLGIRMSFGAYVTAWEETFGASRSEVSLISSVSLILYGLGMPVTGKLVDWFGARLIFIWSAVLMGLGMVASSFAQSVFHLLMLYGVVASVGFCGASTVTSSVSLMQWFPRNRALAVGASSCGIAAGGIILAPLTIYLVKTVGWRQTQFLVGLTCLFLLTGLMWLFFRDAPVPGEGQRTGASSGPEAAHHAQASPLVIAIALAVPYVVCGFTDLGLISTHFVPLAEGRGIPPSIIAWALAVIAIVNLASNLITGHLADRISLTALLSVMYLWRALSIAFLTVAGDAASILFFAFINGMVDAATIAPTAALCAQLYGPGKMGTAYGFVTASHQFGAAAGAYLIGALYVRTQSYQIGLILSVVLLVIAGFTIKLAKKK